jgi:uncharacterized protein (TIGR03083 family)
MEIVGLTVTAHIDALRAGGERLADAAAAAGLAAEVPTCPRWQVRDLLRHTGGVHRWATGNVIHGSVSEQQVREMFIAPDDDELLAWFRAGHAALMHALATVEPPAKCFTFLPAPSPLAFWARRQAHETSIHRVDAESATGDISAFPPEFAADGLRELIEGFQGRRGGSLKADPPVSLAVDATDADASWTVQINPDGRVVTRGVTPADATVRGIASDLYMLLWNRIGRETVQVAGDETVLDIWRHRAKVRWR